MIALVFYLFIVKPTHIEVKTWKAPYEFSTMSACKEAGDSYVKFVKHEPSVRYFCDYVNFK